MEDLLDLACILWDQGYNMIKKKGVAMKIIIRDDAAQVLKNKSETDIHILLKDEAG